MTLFLSLDSPYDETLRWVTETLKQARLQIAPSFDLRIARSAHPDCPCPHHGSAACDCQIVMLLIYGQDDQPATLVIHGSDGRTQLSLTDFPGQRPSPTLRAAILTALTPEKSPFNSHD